MFLRTRTQAYLEKRLAADFYKVPRATAVRILSVVRESILWILKLFSERQGQNELRKSGSLCPYVRYSASHTEVSL